MSWTKISLCVLKRAERNSFLLRVQSVWGFFYYVKVHWEKQEGAGNIAEWSDNALVAECELVFEKEKKNEGARGEKNKKREKLYCMAVNFKIVF